MASANVVELTADNWEREVVQSDKPVLVDFWAPWCAPCRALGPTIDRIADQFTGKIKVGKLNTDEAQDLASDHRVSSIPLVVIFKGGSEVERTVGAQPEANFVKMINRALGS
jgi:thioredoxin 1